MVGSLEAEFQQILFDLYAPTSKKLEGHIASGTFVLACVRASVRASVRPSVTLYDA